MKAKIVYCLEQISYGNGDQRNGWYLMRKTLIDDRGNGLENGAISDRIPVAKFIGTPMEAGLEAENFKGYAQNKCRIFPSDAMITDMAKE